MTFLALASTFVGAGASVSPDREWVLTATEGDAACYSPPSLGNGQLGVVMDRSGLKAQRVFSATAVSRGNGDHVSTVIPAISALQLCVSANGLSAPVSEWKQRLDMSVGSVATSYCLPGLEVECAMTALRSMPFVTLATLKVTATRKVTVGVGNHPVIPSSLTAAKFTPRTFEAGHSARHLLRAEGTYNQGADAMVSTVGIVAEGWTRCGVDSVSITLNKGQQAELFVVASTVTTADFADPWNESERQVLYAVTTGIDNLLQRHDKEWEKLWSSDIIVDGNPQLQSHIRAALYNLYVSVLPGSGRSIPPMGLTSDHYYGHIFWDADTWMLPVLAVLHPDVARDMVHYRIATLPKARLRAQAHGYSGAMFPWESDDTGEESTPTFALTGPLEHHITADVARGAWLYFCATADTAWLRTEAWPLLRDCADFWASRASRNADGTYSVRNVVGADEYAINVDDNAFTNAAAKRCLEYAAQAAALVGERPDPAWIEVGQRLRFATLPGKTVIAEYEGYDGAQIKQADVALLAFPLGFLTGRGEIEANIDHYDSRIDSVGGPAMSHSAMAVNYARMGLGDKAGRLVDRAYRPNLRGPFHNLSESPGNDHTYFVTGAGGLLQALVFGFAGVEIDTRNGGVIQIPSTLPSSLKSVTVKTPRGVFVRSHDEK